jgi:hypothetical protein
LRKYVLLSRWMRLWSWLRIAPLEIYSTAAQLKTILSLYKWAWSATWNTYWSGTRNKVWRYKFKASSKILTKLNIVAVSTYADASKIIRKNFSGQDFTSGSKVTVQNVTIWHKDGKMVIALDLVGSLNGIVYLAGFPNITIKLKKYILIS